MGYVEQRYGLDKSEMVDPRQAADELIFYAEWIKSYVRNDQGRKIPKDARDLLDQKAEDIHEVYRAFSRWQPTRNMVDEFKIKMGLELFGRAETRSPGEYASNDQKIA